jgi:hypothetical protein
MDREEPQNPTITSWDYIKDNFQPEDRLAVVIKTRQEVIQRIATAEKISSKAYQAWLRFKNAHAGEIYISMNTLKPEALGRTKKDIAAMRHLYLDLDHSAIDSLRLICGDSRIPSPSYILNTSDGKYQVIWKIFECDLDRAENLQQSMAIEFNADRAATDVTRVLRIPGFYNHKYDPPFRVTAQQLSSNPRRIEDFTIPCLPKLQSISQAAERRQQFSAGTNPTSQSERDWAETLRRLERGEQPLVVQAWLESSRPDKRCPAYYAALTVKKALDVLEMRRNGPSLEP